MKIRRRETGVGVGGVALTAEFMQNKLSPLFYYAAKLVNVVKWN